MAEECISLSGSKACPSFSEASISTNQDLIDAYSFLQYVTDIDSFDKELENYIRRSYVEHEYQGVLGCNGIQLSNTSSLYARYTKSVLCNGIVMDSKGPCDLGDDTATLCADTCALSAISKQEIATNPELCESPKEGFMDEIRSYYTICGLPEDSLTDSCVSGEDNEPEECGYGPNLVGLCGYCGSSSPNSTDTCCENSDIASKCDGVTVPTTTGTLPPLFPSDTPAPDSEDDGLSGGQIAGIVVGSILGFALIVGLIVLLFIWLRRRRNQQQQGHILNHQTPQSRGMSALPPGSSKKQGYEVLPGGRVARMSALQGPSNPSSPRAENSGAAAFAGAGKFHDSSDSEGYGGSPAGLSRRGPPLTSKRNGSLSSASALAGDPDTSPRSAGGQYSSPMASGQSEQLDFFKDYYSQDDIHPNDKVSVLWAYQPRAGDEFELDRGDMLKVVGIWDDGWATGVRINERAEDYDNQHKVQRDSGVSNGSGRRGSSPQPSGEIKAFPLVCVCLPEHWQKTIDGDINMEATSPV